MKSRLVQSLSAALVALLLAGCGGGGGGSTTTTGSGGTPGSGTTPSTDTNQFTQSAAWTFVLPASGGSLCYDFDAKAEVAGCTGTQWDVKVTSGGRTAALYTNSGPSGTGSGGAFGSPFTHSWSDLLSWKNALVDPTGGAIATSLYFADTAKSVFTGSNDIQSAAFEYDLLGTHQLHPNYRVFLVTSKNTSADAVGTSTDPVFALQVTGYYGGPTGTASGWPSIRWIDRSVGTVNTATFNATSGWTYYNLSSKAVVSASDAWHIAFNRYNIKLNGGSSGSGTAGGFIGATPAGFYDASGKPIVAKFTSGTALADTLADLTGTLAAPASVAAWVKDSIASQLSPAYTGTYPAALDYGWYTYYPTDALAQAAGLAGQHMLKADVNNGTLVKSGEGSSYARMRVSSISYAPATPAYSGTQTWTIEFGVQPAP